MILPLTPTMRVLLMAACASGGAYGVLAGGGAIVTAFERRVHPSPIASSQPRHPAPPRGPMIDEEAWTGVLLAHTVDLTARIETKVKSIERKVGDEVRANDVIAELDTTAVQHELAAAEAALRASRAEAWNASISLSQARDRQSRRGRMVRVGGTDVPLVSQEELSDSKFDSLAAGSRASAASALAEERLARLEQLRQTVHDATLRAPFDGVVATRFAEPGAFVRQGSPVVRVVGRGALRVRFAVPQTESAAVSLRSRVSVEWDGRSLGATIDRIAPEVEPSSSSVFMEAEVDSAGTQSGSMTDHTGLSGRVVEVRTARSSFANNERTSIR